MQQGAPEKILVRLQAGEAPVTVVRTRRRRVPGGRLLAGMRIRKKLIVLHTAFSLALVLLLTLALRPTIAAVVEEAQRDEARLALAMITDRLALGSHGSPSNPDALARALRDVADTLPESITVRSGTAAELAIDPADAIVAADEPGRPLPMSAGRSRGGALLLDRGSGVYVAASAALPAVRSLVVRLYVVMLLAVLAAYALIAFAIETLILPQNVYEPIRRILRADAAIRDGRRADEIIPAEHIPADELGEIMRSRNESILALRLHERELARANRDLESITTDLKRKNHLLETTRRNLADADRLASLGTMSAGLAHEMNSPLAVLKGLTERLRSDPASLSGDEAALMGRVVGRLERLSDSLLDFARVRPPTTRPSSAAVMIEEAWTLVRLDRSSGRVDFRAEVPPTLVVECDPDRVVQVLVNLLRNAVDAMDARPPGPGPQAVAHILVRAHAEQRESREWVVITIEDSGPGIDPDVLKRLFEPFVSTRLDSHGTGLGLAVSEGIVREHGGLLLARNRTDSTGAVFEIILPATADAPALRTDPLEHAGEPSRPGGGTVDGSPRA
ncbi:MAG: hypothetical protein JNM07_00315 [Phycisphaerae bacterium]|nr:hypothetical protein [Phycisphaerae bacterium]